MDRQTICSGFGFLLHDVARLMRRNLNRRVKDLGLTQAQWQALIRISLNEGLSQAKLSDIMEVTPISTARLIDRMEKAGWVERRKDPKDRRALCLYLKPKSGKILDEFWSLAAQTRQHATKGITEKERDVLSNILSRMRDNLITEDV